MDGWMEWMDYRTFTMFRIFVWLADLNFEKKDADREFGSILQPIQQTFKLNKKN